MKTKGDNRGEELKALKQENKNLREELKKLELDNQRYKKELRESSVIHRWKIGKYLHDNLAQQLTSIKISLNLLEEEVTSENLKTACEEIIDLIDDSIDEVRNLSHDVIPMEVEKDRVREAFNYLKRRVERRHGIECQLEQDEVLQKITQREIATNLYHIAEEAIKNAIVHGEAENIKITLIQHDDRLDLRIHNDGNLFDPADIQNGRGILIMRHRSEEMDGEFEIKHSEEDDFSTCVTCSLPMEIFKKIN